MRSKLALALLTLAVAGFVFAQQPDTTQSPSQSENAISKYLAKDSDLRTLQRQLQAVEARMKDKDVLALQRQIQTLEARIKNLEAQLHQLQQEQRTFKESPGPNPDRRPYPKLPHGGYFMPLGPANPN